MTNCENTVIVTIAQDSNSGHSEFDLSKHQHLTITQNQLLSQTAVVNTLPAIVQHVAHGIHQQQQPTLHTLQNINPHNTSVAIVTTAPSAAPTSSSICPQKPFQCQVCDRRFRQLSTLTNHLKIHTGEKPYKCSICEKSFRQSSTLTNHLKIHTGEKPFKCTYCHKLFRQLSTLTNHLKIHTGEKPFECAVCKKQFRQSSTLNNHIKIHVMDKLYFPAFEIKEEVEEEEG